MWSPPSRNSSLIKRNKFIRLKEETCKVILTWEKWYTVKNQCKRNFLNCFVAIALIGSFSLIATIWDLCLSQPPKMLPANTVAGSGNTTVSRAD